MYLDCPDRDIELQRRSLLFSALDPAEQARLFGFVLLNDLRGSTARRENQSQVRALVDVALTGGDLSQTLVVVEHLLSCPDGLVSELSGEAGASRRVPAATWVQERAELVNRLAETATDHWDLSATFAACLVRAGHLPCPGFAFGAWHLTTGIGPDGIRHLVELACCYAYRLVRQCPVADDRGILVGRGAYSVSTRNGTSLTKTAANLAARDFMLEQEARVLQKASQLPMADRLPKFAGWDRATAELHREYIPGPTGHQLLVSGEFAAQPHYVDDLEAAHHVLVAGLRELEVHLDLHPGNFVWHTRRKRWVLVDAGPVPTIGSDYYDLDSFQEYLRAVWLRRLDNMRREPVRSLDWEPLLA